MKKVIIWLLTILVSAQIMTATAVAGTYASRSDVPQSGQWNSELDFRPEKTSACVMFSCDLDETQARCAIEEMSDYVTVGMVRDDVRLCARPSAALDPMFTSIDLPRINPPPRS
jgi:hypothetical protein